MPGQIDRSALRAAYRMEEEVCLAERIRQAAPASAVHGEASRIAARLVEGARARKASGLDAFLQTYGLGTDEGIALMCLAEALLRVPDAATADALIHDKLSGIDWGEHVGESASTFVNAATFSLMLTGQVLQQKQAGGFGASLKRAVGRLGEPVIRQATLQAMKILGGQFVFGRTIDEALERAAPERKQGLTHSFDMLGEAAMTFDDAERYRRSYAGALVRIAQEAGSGVVRSPGISVKLSALFPRYDFFHATAARAVLVPMLKELALQASRADIHFTIDAEEAERLELSMDIIEELVADEELFGSGWQGFGLALQAYSKRAVPLVEWVTALARKYHRRIMVRLVKGAYWDSEVKLSQVGGHQDYPVFTRKVATDVSYLACAAKLLAAPDAIYPAFATHNAYTIGAIKALAGLAEFEFQRLHGMGEDVYEELARIEAEADHPRTPVRIYAPVGGHKELLAYLVRRLLENGANSSFVNRMADAEVPVTELVGDPVVELTALSPRRNPAIPLPRDIFPGRINSAGVDLADPLVRGPLLDELATLAERNDWRAGPSFEHKRGGAIAAVLSPYDNGATIGHVREASAAEVAEMIERAVVAQPGWDALGGAARAERLEAAADLYEAHTSQFLSLCQREAGKSLIDSVAELREAVDFLRYYAAEARAHFTAEGTALPGPTGESNRLTLHGRGVIVAISPWNFPLAIFTGLVAGPLAAGNTVIAKPAEQTPLIAALSVELMHRAGIPIEAVQLAPGDGKVGAMLTGDPRVAGVAFTGSTETARAINRSLAGRDGPLATLVAETGGQNAMIVDSSALPEQVTRDVLASAFQSAGQRCSACRVLFLQDDVYDSMLDMIRGGFEALVIGNPEELATDVGPVIDAEAKAKLDKHIAAMKKRGHRVWQRELPKACKAGTYVAPTIIEIGSIRELESEHFGPILHVVRFKAEALDQVIADINATGFGLTLGLHSRIDATRRLIEAKARVGNFYVNRNQIGAVVGSQPFGGEGLSGTGPKAGGPHYLARFATERVTCIDTTAAGGNASLMASG
ncbi:MULTISPECIES: bifunctional proline dehydrogenase/L-glutamate gamma-semialdehyde dehydrogenase PutA [unclassified Novosphingobium]|uniref:bifunctional proline dehydrogenase/L-glutamate gamma-semialdehyde dehydrogenase PutA n=1 Tax=unclassified Novosphingobium TaxID=2644732 RepID=UPI0025D8022E|nr:MULTISPECIES: bifunctional proline dehydrogenase/L-glutamate gamma-semialdehyde dehydrogenase PutA [unclassified Novosphingobium]HQV04659.1 bifunctional proline dehydrogenase/L-glutamate gamma-semialdehyde dehydrogenase PutA [Novosphingobium sp.]